MRREPLAMLVLALLVAGCATVRPATVTGRWTGTWSGQGVADIPRDEPIMLDLTQSGEGGTGRLVMSGTGAAESVPVAVRDAAMTGVRVVFEVSGSELWMEHELGREFFAARAVVSGGLIQGRILDTWPEIRFVLTREP
jgi:hypothetical protein